MESCLIFGSINYDTGENRLVKVQIDVNKPESCTTETLYVNENTRIVAFEMDTEDNQFIYFLDDERMLYHLLLPEEGKCRVDSVFDLTSHVQMEEQIADFEANF